MRKMNGFFERKTVKSHSGAESKTILKNHRLSLCLCASLGLCLGLFGGFTDYFSPSMWLKADDVIEDESSEVLSEALAPIISAEGAILMNADTGEVIYEKEADKRLYPASTTKIMTTLITLEAMEEVGAGMDSKVIVPKAAVGIEGTSIYLKEGEEVSMEELLYGAMHKSGNDAATCLGICATGSVEEFVDRMNEKTKTLGCRNTHFQNPSGLTDKNHYTTARDLALISREALKNDKFRAIASSKKWPNESSVIQAPGSGRSFKNKNKTITQYEGATGLKIGYTKAAGRTLAASAKKGNVELIAVVLNDANWFDDAYALLDYGFERLSGSVQ